MALIPRHRLNRRLRIERPLPASEFDGAGSGTWEPVKEIWAEVQDMLPSRGERMADGVNASARPSRIRIDYRDGLTANMRFVDVRSGRVMQIVAGPAELGRGEGLEFVVEDYSPAGNAA